MSSIQSSTAVLAQQVFKFGNRWKSLAPSSGYRVNDHKGPIETCAASLSSMQQNVIVFFDQKSREPPCTHLFVTQMSTNNFINNSSRYLRKEQTHSIHRETSILLNCFLNPWFKFVSNIWRGSPRMLLIMNIRSSAIKHNTLFSN